VRRGVLSLTKASSAPRFLKTAGESFTCGPAASLSQALDCRLPECRSMVTRCASVPRSLVEGGVTEP